MPTEWKPSSARVARRYVLALLSAQLITATEVAAVTISLASQYGDAVNQIATQANSLLLVMVSIGAAAVTVVGGHRIIAPSASWFSAGDHPDADQRRQAMTLVRRQSVILALTWAVSGVVLILTNVTGGFGPPMLLVIAALFGATSSVSTGILFTQRVTRPIIAAANEVFIAQETAPGVTARLVLMWLVNSALPSVAIASLVVCHAFGWFIPRTASVVIPVVVLTAVSVALGLRALVLVARSISDPVREVVEAMSEVERGQLGQKVDVYEQSEIGRLQDGFNRMVTGLAERDRLRDLFGRHVGPDVARRALDADEPAAGDVRDVAVLFIDLMGSTTLATTYTPREVADILNGFFQIVVAAVDHHDGMINKFQGDAALAVFGAPIATDGAATAALATARALGMDLQCLPIVDFGIGVSAGPVFAGNIGAENRYEYTVVGDPVNEAARLADAAKASPGRVMSSGPAIDGATESERREWAPRGSMVLRGRSEPTQVSVPREPRGKNGQA